MITVDHKPTHFVTVFSFVRLHSDTITCNLLITLSYVRYIRTTFIFEDHLQVACKTSLVSLWLYGTRMKIQILLDDPV
jgi:hypothetical protein